MPAGYPADYLGFIDFTETEILRIAADLQAEGVNCVEGLGQPHAHGALVDSLGKFSEKAAANGLRVTLEFMPISSIQDLAAAWAIVSEVSRANLGLCFDTWHYFRSKPDAALLETIPGGAILEVQLADALLALQGRDLNDDLLRFRRLPGEGEMDIASVVATLKRIGAWRSVGPEVFADAFDALDAVTAGRRCGENLAWWIGVS